MLQATLQESMKEPWLKPHKCINKKYTYHDQVFFLPNQTTKEFKIPTANTNRNQRPTPEKTKLRLLTQPFGSANVYGTPTTRANERAIRANTDA